MRASLGLLLLGLSACATASAPPATVALAPQDPPSARQDPLPPAVGPLVAIEGEHVTLGGKVVGSVREIEGSGGLRKVDGLFEALKERRAAERAAQGSDALSVAGSLVVAPGTSGRVFGSVYQTMVFAGFPNVHVAAGGRFHKTAGPIPGPPCGDPGSPCPPRPRAVLHVQADERGWRLRVPREGGPIDASGEGPRATVEGFHAAAMGIMSSAGVDSIVLHVPQEVPFARFAPFLADVVDLGQKAGLAGTVLVVMRGIDSVSSTARAEAPALSGRLAPEHIQKVVRASYGKLRRCYELALAKDAGATGRTSTRFVIDREGKVTQAKTELGGALPPEMSPCMEVVFRSLKFDAPDGGIVTVTYPIVFSPSE